MICNLGVVGSIPSIGSPQNVLDLLRRFFVYTRVHSHFGGRIGAVFAGIAPHGGRIGAVSGFIASAECRRRCTQPTRHFHNQLNHNHLQKHGVGRHFNFMHSADTTFLQTTDTQRVTKPRYRPTPHESALSRHPPQNPTNNNHPYTHTLIHSYTHTPQIPNTYTANKFTVSPTKTIQRLLYLQRCGHRFIQQRTNNKGPLTTKPPTVIPDLIGEANMEITKQP